jgi:ubiquitin C-terminal hydrolase
MSESDEAIVFPFDVDFVGLIKKPEGKSDKGRRALTVLRDSLSRTKKLVGTVMLKTHLRSVEDLGDGHVVFGFENPQTSDSGRLAVLFHDFSKKEEIVDSSRQIVQKKSRAAALGASPPPETPPQKSRGPFDEKEKKPETPTPLTFDPEDMRTPTKTDEFNLRDNETHGMFRHPKKRESTTPGEAPPKRDRHDTWGSEVGTASRLGRDPSPRRSNFELAKRSEPKRGFHHMLHVPRRPVTSKEYTQSRITVPRAFGLANLGNTCYLNAVMQSLRAIKPFMTAVESTPQPVNSLFGVVADVWRRMAGKTEVVRPDELKSRMAKLNPMFAGNAEHDAHEFCLELLNQMHDELLAEQKKQPTVQDDEKKPLAIPTQIFDFTCSATLQCRTCGYERSNPEMYRDLSIDLPPVVDQGTGLQKLVDDHFKAEDVEYRCEKCTGTLASSSRSVQVAPAVLAMHVKRFTPNFSTNRIEKRSDKISFPQVWETQWPEASRYHLQSFVSHVGSSASTGHYVCYARGDQGWQEFDDSRVREIAAFDQLPVTNTQSGGYLFFYVRE